MSPDQQHHVVTALDAFVARYLDLCPHLHDVYDPEWPSPCEIGEPWLDDSGERRIRWQPTRRGPGVDDFIGLERALEMPIHPAIKAYYGRYWSGGLEARAPEGHVSLLLLWSPDDANRLIENLIGHALAKRRVRSPFTVFFACTEPDSDLFLGIDNDSGRVVLEEPGRKPLRVVAESLGEFLDSLTPAAPTA